MDGEYKHVRKRALTAFESGDDSALERHWDALASNDADKLWNPRYLARLRACDLRLDEILFGNIALCATEGDKYPPKMLSRCWDRHTKSLLSYFAPSFVVLMGSSAVMDRYVALVAAALPNSLVTRVAHYAHRKGRAYEAAECERVRAFVERRCG
jgi:hypothetical protein